MPLSTKKKQLYVREESKEFLPIGHATLRNASFASFLPLNASVEYDPDLQENEEARTTYTKTKRVPGKSTGKLRVELSVTASGASASQDPQFQLLLRACGVRQSDLTKVIFNGDLGNGDTIIRHGTTFVGAVDPTGVATGMVIGDVHLPATPASGAATMWVARQEGLGSGVLSDIGDIVLTYKGAAAGTIATADIDSVTPNAGTGFWPHSTPLSKVLFNATGLTTAVTAGMTIRDTVTGAFARVYKDQATAVNATVYIESPSGHFGPASVIEIVGGDADIGTLATGGAEETQVSCPTVEFGLNEDGIYSSFFGGRGNAVLTIPSAKRGKIAFEISGVFQDVSDAPFVTGVSLPQHIPPTFRSSNFLLGAYDDDPTSVSYLAAAKFAPCVAQVSLNLGNVVTPRECSNSSGGVLGYVIDDRNPKITLDPDVPPEGGFSWVGRLFAADQVYGSLNLGTTPPDKFILGWPAGQPEQVPTAARGNTMIRNVTLGLNAGPIDTDTGDNEWWLIWQVG